MSEGTSGTGRSLPDPDGKATETESQRLQFVSDLVVRARWTSLSKPRARTHPWVLFTTKSSTGLSALFDKSKKDTLS
jgi:hypothetical protein